MTNARGNGRWQRGLRTLVLLMCAVAILGCAARKAYHRAEQEMRRENFDLAVLGYSKALALDPGNTRYGVALERAKLRASAEHFDKGRRFANAQQWELAVAEYQQVLLMHPGHQYAASELQRAARELQRLAAAPSELEQLKERARRADLGPPRLDPRTNIPIVLNFRETEVGKIFEAISKASGINFIFDEKTDLDKPMTIDIGNVTMEKALDILLLQTKNFLKVIDEYTLLIAPDTRQKRQEYEDQVIRTFFLSNADTKQVVTLLRSLLQSRQIAENEKLNSLTIKDTPDKVAIAERILNANDKSKGEVIIDVELLEINRNTTRTIGLDLSSKSLSLSFKDGKQSVALNDLNSLKQEGNWTLGVIPSVVLNLLKSDNDTKTIAKPQLRVSEGEQAEILIGDRVPIPTTSFNTSQTIGGNIVPITSFTYQNVGITLQIEPRVHHNKEVTLKIQVEISQIASFVEATGGQQPIIGTRQIQTVIRLRDGETNLLAGLIQRSDQNGRAGLAGLSEIPGLGRLFSTNSRQSSETDIIMTLTPRIIRIPDITQEDLATLWVGTEDNVRLRGSAQNALGQSPFRSLLFADEPTAAAPPRPADERRSGSLSRIAASQETGTDRGRLRPRPAPSAPPTQEEVAEPPGAEVGGIDAPGGSVPVEGGAEGSEEAGIDEGLDEPPSFEEPPENDAPSSEGAAAGTAPEERPRGPATVQLVPSKPSYSVGETIVVQVYVAGAQNVGSIPFHLRYNKDVLQYIPPAQEGPFMSSDGTSTVFLASDTGGGGEVVVGLSRMGGGAGASGSGNVATFQFQAVAPGDCGFVFTGASVKDPQARNVPASFSTVAVRVQP